MQALQEVDERYRSSLSLFYLERMTYSEIAETLETPIGTVMSRISRGRSQLRALLSSRMTAEDRKVTVFRRTGTEPD
jgi:RNA polymerase sigma-70 factor, ECF subfamily